MSIFQSTTTGYRDPLKAMTIKALQDRQKEAALASAKAAEVPQIASPWQGLAHLSDIAATGMQEGRIASAEADARGRLAEIMRGVGPEGPTQQQLADMSALDPDRSNKMYDDLQRIRQENASREDTQAEARAAAATAADVAAGVATTANERQVTEKQREEGVSAGVATTLNERQVAEKKREEEAAAAQKTVEDQAKIDAIGRETDARRAEAEKQGLKPGTPEYDAYVLRGAAPPIDPMGGRQAMKDVKDMQLEASHYDSTLDALNLAKELAPNVPTGTGNYVAITTGMKAGALGRQALKAAGYTDAQIDATMRFDQIMGAEAVQRMSATLKGQTSNYEMATFTRIMNNPDSSPQQRLDAITQMENAVKKDRSVISNSLFQYGSDPLPDYAYDRGRVVAGPAPAPSQSPAAVAGTGAPAAPDIPQGETPEQKEKRLREKYGKR